MPLATQPCSLKNPLCVLLELQAGTSERLVMLPRQYLQQQLYMSMVGQALFYTSMMAAFRTRVFNSLPDQAIAWRVHGCVAY